jgi:D-alanyl-D-alanine carboxypeptidase/D-alanyl-D-alanine-endopeptidase (penicillin-binding protein 4)
MSKIKILKILSLSTLVLFSCQPTEVISESEPEIRDPIALFFEESRIFNQSTTGFALYDPESGTLIYDRDADRFFTPASNTKILTLYASLKALPDTLPSIRYQVRNDTLYFRGTGDPAFLNPEFDFTEPYQFLKNSTETLVYYDGHFKDDHFGAGWSWDWYPAPYAPEKSPFPIYGNMMRLQAQQVALVMLNEEEPVKPRFFERYIRNTGWDGDQLELVKRDYQSNEIFYVPKSDTLRQERNIPFKYERDLFLEMLSDTLGREVGYINDTDIDFSETVYGTTADSLYKRMMQVSDNFVAEQLMLMISDMQFGVMNSEEAIRYALSNYLGGLPQQPRWSDGSGLTRYNLVTPHTMVVLLERLMDEYGEERTLSWFPAGGVSGTISGFYRAPAGEPPYVYAKTGTLRNNTALSGYLFTHTGKRLNFSIINNNYVIGNHSLRAEMGRLLELIRQSY